MWKLIDCGTYLWFVLEKQKYFHCIYSVTGECKKLKTKRIRHNLYAGSDKMYLAYLKTWPLDKSPCILDRRTKKYYIDNWKKLNKTKRMKEILKQLRTI